MNKLSKNYALALFKILEGMRIRRGYDLLLLLDHMAREGVISTKEKEDIQKGSPSHREVRIFCYRAIRFLLKKPVVQKR